MGSQGYPLFQSLWLGYVVGGERKGGALSPLELFSFTQVRLTVQNLQVGTVTPAGVDGAGQPPG